MAKFVAARANDDDDDGKAVGNRGADVLRILEENFDAIMRAPETGFHPIVATLRQSSYKDTFQMRRMKGFSEPDKSAGAGTRRSGGRDLEEGGAEGEEGRRGGGGGGGGEGNS